QPAGAGGTTPPSDMEAIQREVLQRAACMLASGDMLSIARLLPIERAVESDWYVARIPLLPVFLNPMGILHGGVTAVCLDSAMGWSIAERTGRQVVTVQLNVNYVKPGRGRYLVVRARPTHTGRFTAVAEGRVEDEKGDLIALGTGTFFFTGEEAGRL
ncbi:MAG TPA: PaaI family thioesterase, partial [Limnochorda sp.]